MAQARDFGGFGDPESYMPVRGEKEHFSKLEAAHRKCVSETYDSDEQRTTGFRILSPCVDYAELKIKVW